MRGVMRINRRALALLLLLLPLPALSAQAGGGFPYALDPIKDAAWVAGDLGLIGAGIYLDGIKPSAGAAAPDKSKIPFFDALYTTAHNAALGTAADVLVIAFAAAPAVTLPGLSGREMLTVGTMYGETLGLAYGLDEAIKSLVLRDRPYAYSSPPPSDLGSLDIGSSFPSRHSTLAFASAVFAGSVFDELHPGSPYRAAVWAGGLAVATFVASIRVASGDHFISDVAAGAALGTLMGFGVPYLHRAASGAGETRAKGLSLSPAGTGLIVSYRLAP
jgi:membrane-associated phospholipid phosphatase